MDCGIKMNRPLNYPLVLDAAVLENAESFPVPGDSWSVDEVQLIASGRSSVYRANLRLGHGEPLATVLKIDPTGNREADFLREAVEYQTRAKELQDSIVPLFYGCFQAQVGPITVTCLAIQYCGERMTETLDKVDGLFLYALSEPEFK